MKFLATVLVLLAISVSAGRGEEKRREHMFAVPCLDGDPDMVDWKSDDIPALTGEETVLFAAVPGAVYNNHSYIAHYDGRFWAMWSTHPTDGNEHGMYVRYATSADGRTWSKPGQITPVPSGKRYVARGFWEWNGEILALASLDSGRPELSKQTGNWAAPDLELQTFRYLPSVQKWEFAGVVHDDTINNYPPRQLPGGEWLLDRRDHTFALSFLIGGAKAIDDWKSYKVPNPEGRDFNEPDFLIRPDGSIAAHIRDNSRSKRIYRSVSTDGGRTWTVPVETDFPDATSKNFNLRLSSGSYILLNNPNPKGRIPLALSLSRDGVLYERMGIVAKQDGKPRMPGHDKGPGYTYPHAVEYGGELYIIYSRHRDDIVVKRISIETIERLPSPCAQAGGDKGNRHD